MSEIAFNTYWYGGAGAIERAQNLAEAGVEAVHTLNYATMAGNGGMAYPSHAGHLLGALRSMVGHMPQLLDQIGDFVDGFAGDERLYHDQPGKDAAGAALRGREEMRHAAALADALMHALSRADATMSHLGLRIEEDEPEAPAEPTAPHPMCPDPACIPAERLPWSASGVPR